MTLIGISFDGNDTLDVADESRPSVYRTSVAALIVAERPADTPVPAAKVPVRLLFTLILKVYELPPDIVQPAVVLPKLYVFVQVFAPLHAADVLLATPDVFITELPF